MKKIKLFRDFLLEELDYTGEHSAPTRDDSPMYDLSDTYGDDIYSLKGAYYYGVKNDDYSDEISLNIIRNTKGKPNYRVMVYRAVPDLNYDINKKMKAIKDILNYREKFRFLNFPPRNPIVSSLEAKYSIDEYTYNEQQEKIREDLEKQLIELSIQKKKSLAINSGDWVTINKEYAKAHGRDNLKNKYKILSKIVKASQLYTDGNSVHEWGYNQ
jgi:hypothetical protein